MHPPNIDSAREDVRLPTSYEISGIALTSRHDLAVVERRGSHRAALYSSELVYIMTLSVTGANELLDIASSDDILFLTDVAASKIHVMRDNGSYVHDIPTGWQPYGIDVNGNYLYVVDRDGDKLYQIEINNDFIRVGSDQVILDQGPFNGGPVLSYPT